MADRTMITAPALVESADLPEYPIGREVRMQGHFFTMWDHARWLNSEMHLTATPEIQAHFMNLCFHAQSQRPLGTLPDNDQILARMLRLDLSHWQNLRRASPGPLHKWQRCQCDDEVRLMHPVVFEVVCDALARREARQASNESKAVYQRLQRLRQALEAMGMSKAVLSDDVLIERMDHWLVKNHRGQRRQNAYDRVVAHASREGWLTGRFASR